MKNKKEDIIFTMLMCGFMVIFMDTFNTVIHIGFTKTAIISILKSLIPTYIVAFLINYFVVKKNAIGLALKLTDKEKIRGLLIPLLIVTGMSSLMCIWGTFIMSHPTGNQLTIFLENWIPSFIFALILQLTIAKKIVQKIFVKVTNKRLA